MSRGPSPALFVLEGLPPDLKGIFIFRPCFFGGFARSEKNISLSSEIARIKSLWKFTTFSPAFGHGCKDVWYIWCFFDHIYSLGNSKAMLMFYHDIISHHWATFFNDSVVNNPFLLMNWTLLTLTICRDSCWAWPNTHSLCWTCYIDCTSINVCRYHPHMFTFHFDSHSCFRDDS